VPKRDDDRRRLERPGAQVEKATRSDKRRRTPTSSAVQTARPSHQPPRVMRGGGRDEHLPSKPKPLPTERPGRNLQTAIYVRVTLQERDELRRLAGASERSISQQARVFIRKALAEQVS